MILRYTDPRRFGAWLWCEDLATSSVLAHLGPEPLSEAFNGDYQHEKSRNKRTLIKPWLMDNKLVVGVGNIYASESLFSAGILPDRPAGSLSKAEAERLVKTIKAVLQRSIEQGGTTCATFAVGRQTGVFRAGVAGLRAGGRTCRACGTPIESAKARAAQHLLCRRCQRLGITSAASFAISACVTTSGRKGAISPP